MVRVLLTSFTRVSPCLLAVMACGLSSCSGKSEPRNKTSYAEMKWSQRVDAQFKDPRKISSSLSKKVYKPGKAVEATPFRTKEYEGAGKYKTRKYNTESFAQADKRPQESGMAYADATEASPFAGKEFNTGESSWEKKVPWYADKTAASSQGTYKTRSEPQARKAQEKPSRPFMLPDAANSNYTEFDIRKLLRRD